MALEAQRGDHRGQGLVPRIDPVAAQEEMDVRQTALESGGGAEEVRVVLERVVPRDEPDERGVRGEAEVLAHVAPGCGVGAENVGVEAVGDDCQPLRREAPPRVRLPDRFGAANDPGGEPPGQPGARRDGHQGGALGEPGDVVGVMHPPDHGGPGGEPGRHAPDEVGMVHPGLDDLRPLAM